MSGARLARGRCSFPTALGHRVYVPEGILLNTHLGQKSTRPLHVRSIRVAKAGEQILLFLSRPDDHQHEGQPTGHEQEPVGSNQRAGKDP